MTDERLERLLDEIAGYRRALELIAAPCRPDGSYNRDRRACELLAREELDRWRS